LREHCTEGRLTLDEFSDRLEEVFAARTWGELDLVLRGLPMPAVPASHALPIARRKARRWVIGIMSQGKTKGRWRTSEKTTAIAFMGGAEIDLRDAEFQGPEVHIAAMAFMGGIEIIVPEGIEVHVSGLPFMGSVDDSKLADVPVIPGTPVIKVRAVAFMGSVMVRSRKSEEEERALREEKRRQRRQRHIERHSEMRDARRSRDPRERRHPRERHALEELEASVPVELPELRARAAPDGTVTVLFSDVENSTEMNERLGDQRWWAVLQAHNDIVRGQVVAHGGFEVKSAGDGFMVAFSSARRALLCAVAVQQGVSAYNEDHAESALRVRIGLHTGEAIKEADDFFGRNVTMAARIAGHARGGEILASSLVRALAESSGEVRFGSERAVSLKGLTGTHHVVEVEWGPHRGGLGGEHEGGAQRG